MSHFFAAPNPVKPMTTRKITTCYYVRADGYEYLIGEEPSITVEVEQEDRFTARVCDDLDELGVPADEQAGVRERAIEQFWAAEHSAWLQSPEGEASGQ